MLIAVFGCALEPSLDPPLAAVHCPGNDGGDISLLGGDGTTVLGVNIYITEGSGQAVYRWTPDDLTGFWVATARAAHRHCGTEQFGEGDPNWNLYNEIEGTVEVDGTEATWERGGGGIPHVGNGPYTVSWSGLVVREYIAPDRDLGPRVAIEDGSVTFEIDDFEVFFSDGR